MSDPQAIIEKHKAAAIERQLIYYRYALAKNMTQGPGWLVLTIGQHH